MADYPKLWIDKKQKIVDPKLFSEKAEKLAEKIFLEGDNQKNKPSQIRKFYDEVIRINELAKKCEQNKNNAQKWVHIVPMVYMINAKAAYAKGRDHITESFHKFITTYINLVENPEDLALFANFFEAFMGYYKYYRPNERKERKK